MRGIFRCENEIVVNEEGPFPAKILLSKLDTQVVSVKVGKLSVGSEIPIHSHKDSSQLEYYPKGRAILFLETLGEKRIRPGAFMFAPKGVKHGIRSVTEELVIYSVFIPAIF